MLTDDWPLIRKLKVRHIVTLMKSFRFDRLGKERLFKTVKLLVIDCRDCADEPRRLVEAIGVIRARYSGLNILVVDGQLDQDLVAEAFRHGARDYFKYPYPRKLLAERIDALCREPPHRRA
jgi:hypothetical protein